MSTQEMLALVIILARIVTIVILVTAQIGRDAVLQSEFVSIVGHLDINQARLSASGLFRVNQVCSNHGSGPCS